MKGRALKTSVMAALSSVVILTGHSPVYAANLSLAQTPLFLGASIQPNVFFVQDDSGSMDWELMTRAHWQVEAYDPDPDRNGTNANGDGGWRVTDGFWWSREFIGGSSTQGFEYYYNLADHVYGGSCTGSRERVESCAATTTPFDLDWRGHSIGLNSLFYSPTINYTPWPGPCDTGVQCADANFFSARSNPVVGEAGYGITRDLSTDGDAANGPFVYEVWIDDAGWDQDVDNDGIDETFRPRRGTNVNYEAVPNGEIDLWDSHVRFTVRATDIIVEQITYAPDTTGLNQTTAVIGTLTGGACYDALGPVTTLAAATNLTATGGPGCRSIAETQTNAANWYSYYRRRSFPVKNAIAAVIDAQPTFRYGLTLLNQPGSLFVEVPDASVINYSSHNTNLKQDFYQHNQGAFGTPLRLALRNAGEYYEDDLTGKDNPILYSCQKNFTVLFTDGFWNGGSPGVGDQDSDGISNTLADVAYRYYMNDLNGTIANNVLVDAEEDDLPTYDVDGNRTHQHMVTFTVAFGVVGNMVDEQINATGVAGEDTYPDLTASGGSWGGAEDKPEKDGNWGNPFNSDFEKIDDMWHAAFNTSGTYANASTPTEVVDKLIDAITNIAARTSSAAAVALNSGTLNANSRVYQAKFDSNDWSGELVSIPIQDGPVDADNDGNDDSPSECNAYPTVGELCDEEWNAAEQLANKSAGTRNIFTINTDTNAAVEFKTLSDLGASQQTALRTNPDTLAVEGNTVGQDRIDYLRGDDSNEGSGTGEFRVRKVLSSGNSKLGDIINSSPVYVGTPEFFIPDDLEASSYNSFRVANKNRQGMVYVGANDGMLHAFNSDTGEEEFAYVPSMLIDRLPLLTSQNYNSGHGYFVDGSPILFDAYNGSAWKSVVATSLGAGGQGVFALDVTSPTSFGTSDVLWEFSDADDADLGFTIGEVAYAKMENGRWAVIFGNGYNNTAADGNVSTTGNAAVYVVDAFTGALIKKFDTLQGMTDDPLAANRPNGMAQVTPVDLDGDFIADYIYSADLFGNVWKIDVTASNPTSWDFAYQDAGAPKPFFIARDGNGDIQPITAGVAVKRHPTNRSETLVLFGTGKYIEVGDSAIPVGGGQIQTFYSIWDDGNNGSQYDRGDLLEQEILDEQVVTGLDGEDREFRVTSSGDADTQYRIDWSSDKGWYMDLRYGTTYGERVVIEPVLRNNRVIFVTLIPDEDPCNDGGDGWIMELNANDGNRLNQSPFDVNGDGLIDDLDIVSFGSEDTIVSGVKSREGIVAKPGILNNPEGRASEIKYFSGTSGNIDVVKESAERKNRKRQSWRQIR